MLARATADEVRELIEPIANPVAVLEPYLPAKKMRFLVVNSHASLASGYSVEALEGRFLGDVLPAEVARRITTLGFECLATGKSQTYEDTGPLPSGMQSWQGSISPIINRDTGAITRLMLSITEYSRDTRSLSRYNRFFELSQDMIAIADADGYFVELNGSWEKVLGWPRETLQQHPFSHWVHPDDIERTTKEAERVAAGAKAIDFENRYRHRDGSYRWLQWHANFTEDGLLFCIARDITEQRVRTRALRRQTRMLEQAEQLAQFGHWRYDVATQTTTLSNQAYRIYGYNPYNQVDLDKLLSAYSPDDHERIRQLVERAIRERSGFTFEAPTTLPNGSRRYTAMRGYVEHNDQGDVAAVFGIVQDITERKDAEDALKKQRRFTEQVIDALPMSVYVKDADGRFRFFNQSASDAVHRDKLGVLGKNDFDLFPEEVATRIRAEDDEVRQGGVSSLYEENVGDGAWLLMGKRPIEPLDHDGGDPWLLGFSFDISKRKQVELDLAAQNAFVQQILDNDPNLIFIKDAHGNFVMANQAIAKLFGVDPATLVGASNRDVHKQIDEVQGYDQIDQDVIDTGATIQIEEPFTMPDGTLKTFETTKMPFVRPDGEMQVLAISVDVSERKAYEESLREAKEAAEAATRAKSAFLATMSHEIRTPLNAVIGMTGLLLDTELNDEQKGYTTAAKHAGEHLLQLISDILDVSKLDAGKVSLEVHPFSLRQEVETVADMARLTAKRKGLTLVTHLAPELVPFVRGDAARLRQVLLNLVGNAVKFTEAGEVRIDVDRDDTTSSDDLQNVHIRVSDTGIGIAPDALDKLFDEFSQADSSTTRRFGGTGLGLAISHRLVELMGGEIWPESRVGTGTTFHVRLPMPVSDEPVDETTDTFDLSTASEPLRILVAEDNRPNQVLIQTLLSKAGHTVDIAGNGLETLEAVQNLPYDLILMDVQMPEMDGTEATRRIRALAGKTRDIPIIALTAEASGGTREYLLAAGMDDYLTKPIDRKKLARALHRWGRPTDTAVTPHEPLASPAKVAAPPPDVPPTDDVPLIDDVTVDELRDILGHDAVINLFEEFDASLDTVVSDFTTAYHDADLDQIKRLGHSLKGSAGSLGTSRLSELAATIERAAQGGLEPVSPHLGTLHATVGATRNAIRRHVTQTAPEPL